MGCAGAVAAVGGGQEEAGSAGDVDTPAVDRWDPVADPDRGAVAGCAGPVWALAHGVLQSEVGRRSAVGAPVATVVTDPSAGWKRRMGMGAFGESPYERNQRERSVSPVPAPTWRMVTWTTDV
ncbi:hypothetical protein FRACA_2450005 [Frankia canadensis]|uniref:Uncharacterized protein n=1 Tax=Frankia canadensis TaxID=1836972 RepID=A0A2I2KRU4_9ACTN|nr:hypothetical protein FRACA_2450005 [Frankia canadensis]SOU55681.1 hypothetical protein FRACA_2450005 [Frankia canadensis]